MQDDYRTWIAENVHKALGTCAEVTQRMAAAFPELRRVRGHYHCPLWGPRTHWWLVTADGTVVDPTAEQFPSKGGDYEEWVGPEPTGKCPNCGGYCYDGRYLCSDECETEYVHYVNSVAF